MSYERGSGNVCTAAEGLLPTGEVELLQADVLQQSFDRFIHH